VTVWSLKLAEQSEYSHATNGSIVCAQHYGVAPQRVSAAILVSTALSVITLAAIIAWITLIFF